MTDYLVATPIVARNVGRHRADIKRANCDIGSMTLGEAVAMLQEPFACACAGCFLAEIGCEVCSCRHYFDQAHALVRAAHITIKLIFEFRRYAVHEMETETIKNFFENLSPEIRYFLLGDHAE